MITAELTGNTVTLGILSGPTWGADLDRIKGLPIRSYDKDSKKWSLPLHSFDDLYDHFDSSQILLKGDLPELLLRRSRGVVAWNSLPLYDGEVDSSLPLYPFQEKFYRIHESVTRLILALDLGLGKTLTSLNRLRRLIKPGQNLLVISPRPEPVVKSWLRDIKSVLGMEAETFYMSKAKRVKFLQERAGQKLPAVVTTFEHVRELSDSDLKTWDHIIIDEAHQACGWEENTQRFQDVDALLSRHGKASLQLLTGTPIQHEPNDLWALFYFIDRDWAGSPSQYRRKYLAITKHVMKYGKRVPVGWRIKNEKALKEKLDMVCYRVARQDVSNLQEVINIIPLEMSERQKEAYESASNDLIMELESGKFDLKILPVRLLRLLQICEGMFNLDPNCLESSKLDYLIELLSQISEKVIVWARFKTITNLLYERFKDRAVLFNGDCTQSYKQLAQWAFNGLDSPDQEDEYWRLANRYGMTMAPGEAQFLFGVIDMRGVVGSNFHRYCWHQIVASFNWMGAANEQALGRLKRIGQTSNTVFSDYLVMRDTFEVQALELVLGNYANSVGLVDGQGSANAGIAKELLKRIKKERRRGQEVL